MPKNKIVAEERLENYISIPIVKSSTTIHAIYSVVFSYDKSNKKLTLAAVHKTRLLSRERRVRVSRIRSRSRTNADRQGRREGSRNPKIQNLKRKLDIE